MPGLVNGRAGSDGLRLLTVVSLVTVTTLHGVTAVLERMADGPAIPSEGEGVQGSDCAFEFIPRNTRQPTNTTHTTQFCSLFETSKFSNKYCDALPFVQPSAGCNAVDLSEWLSRWMAEEQSRTVWLWGDSIMKQVWSHILCLLSAAVPAEHISQDDANLEFVATSLIPPQPKKKKKKRRKRTKGVASWLDWGPKGVGGNLLEAPLTWSPELADASCNPIYGCARFGALRLCFGDLFEDSAFHKPETVSCFINSAPTDIHVLNYGMWHNDPRGIPVATNALSSFLKAVAGHRGREAMPHMVWFETTPQHFLGPGGLFSTRPGVLRKGCMKEAPLQEMRDLEFRNRLTLPILNSSSLQAVAPMHLFRTWELLAPHPQLHDQVSKEKVDCVHWCEYDGNVLMALGHILLSDLSRTFWGAHPRHAPRYGHSFKHYSWSPHAGASTEGQFRPSDLIPTAQSSTAEVPPDIDTLDWDELQAIFSKHRKVPDEV